MNNQFKPLKSGEVICVANPVQFVSPHNTFRVSEFADAVKQELIKYSGYGVTEEDLGWLSAEGSECAVLQFGSRGWQKGKIRLKIEFCPDESVDPYTTFHHETINNTRPPSAPPPKEIQSSTPPGQNYAPLDEAEDPFSSEPDLDFIAESATLLELDKPNAFNSQGKNISEKSNSDELEMLSQSLEDELNAFSENQDLEKEEDPFANAGNDEFSDSDDEDNFGFDELGLGEDEDLNEDDSIWKDL